MQILCKSAYIGIIQSRFDFVEQTKRRGLQVLNCKEQCNGGQRLFSAGQLHHVLKLLPRRLGNDADTRFQDVLIGHQLQSPFSAAEQLLENLVEFPADFRKLLGKLLPHGSVQLLDNTLQRLLRLHQVIPLGFHKGKALQQVLIIFYGIDVYVSQFFNLITERHNLLLHGRQVRHLLISEGSRIAQGNLILIPHIVDLVFNGFFQLFFLGSQTIRLLVQYRKLLGKLLPPCKKAFLTDGKFFFMCYRLFQPALGITLCLERVRNVFFNFGNILLPAFHFLPVCLQSLQDFRKFISGFRNFPVNTFHVALLEPLRLAHSVNLQLPL